MKILVTGGSGFIGSHLVGQLIKDGHQVRIFDTTKSFTYPEISIQGDVNAEAALSEALRGVDVVFHLAAVHKDNESFQRYHTVNVEGAKTLIRCLEKNNVRKVIFTSSVAVYGLEAINPDEESPAIATHPYGKTKYEAEKLFQEWVMGAGDRTLTIVRPSAVYGIGSGSNITNLIEAILSEKFIMVGSGKNKKSMSCVDNLASFLIKTLDVKDKVQVFNYAEKPDLTMNELVKLICLATEQPMPKRIPYWMGMLIGHMGDLWNAFLPKKIALSSLRVKKFCAATTVNTDKMEQISFEKPFSITESIVAVVLQYADNRKNALRG